MIDVHAHILPGLDDGSRSWDESLKMAQLAATDGIRVMVATPHLFKDRIVGLEGINTRDTVLETLTLFQKKLSEAGIDLEVLPGCDFPLSLEALQLLDEDQALTINDFKRYLLLELPDSSLPPTLDEICFRLQSKGITPIITHPERHFIFHEMPQKLKRLLDLGCLVQMTGTSLTGGFGRRVKKFSRQLVKKGYVHLLATDCHDTRRRPPLLREAVKELSGLVGEVYAQAMVTTVPEKIIEGKPIV